MKKADKTKINIKVDNLSTVSRKELFNKFIKAGGKITDEDEPDDIIKKSNKTKILVNKEEQFLKKDIQRNLKKELKTEATGTEKKNIIENKPNLLTKISHKLLIRLRLYFMNVTDFSAFNFNSKFFHLFNTEYKIALMGIRILYLELFKQNQNLEYQIINKLEKINPFDIRLIEEASGLYNENELAIIIKDYLKSPVTVQPIAGIKEQLLSLFKKIYLLKPYERNIFTAYERSIGYYIKAANKKSSEYNSKRRNLKDDLYIIFEKLFPALYWLLCRYHNKIIALGSPEIEAILKTKPDNKTVENIKKSIHEHVNKEIKEEPDPDGPEKENIQLTLSETAGLEMLNRFIPSNINELRSLYDQSDTFAHVNNNDKMLYTYLIFQEFDLEYSFLLTTGKIKYKFDYLESGYINFKDKFLDLYNNIKGNMDLLKEYAISFEILHKVQNEKPLTNDRYIAYTKELNALSNRRQQAANSAKYSILGYMTEISNVLQSLIDDIKGSNKIIDNPDEVINFEIPADKNKKLNNKTVSESLTMAFNFANAFAYKLSRGDLSGELEFDLSEMKSAIKGTKATSSQRGESKTDHGKESSDETTEEESIMDELDDIAKDQE